MMFSESAKPAEVFVGEKLPISGRFDNSPVDFVIECNNTLILITESKKQDMDQGLAQCGIPVWHVSKKRKRENVDIFVPEKP